MERERDMELQLARLATTVEGGFREVSRRMDVQDKTLLSIDEQARLTNGRVTRHDERIGQIQAALSSAAGPFKGEEAALTVERVKQFGAFGGWLVAGILGLLKLMGKL